MDKELKEIFVQNVRRFCQEKGVKPTNACKESGVGSSFLSDIARGQTPSVTKVQKLAQYLGVTTSELLGEEPSTKERRVMNKILSSIYIPVRERIFNLLESKAISQRDFAQTLDVIPQTITDWRKGRSFSFMKKLPDIAKALDTTEAWLLTGDESAQDADLPSMLKALPAAPSPEESGTMSQKAGTMNPKYEIDPALLGSAVEIMRDAAAYYQADACALARLDTPEARELAQERLESAKTAETLLYFFGSL